MEYFLFLFLSAVTIFLRLSGSLVYFCWLLLAVMWSEWFSVRRICLGNLHVETLDGPYLMRAPLEGTCLCAWRPPWALLTHDHLKTKPWVWVFIGFVTRIARRSCGTQRLYVFLPLVQRKAGLWPLNFISGKKNHPGCLLRHKGKHALFPTPCLFQVADSFPAGSSLSSTSFPGLQHQFMTIKNRNVFSYSSGSQTSDIHLARLCFLEKIHPHLFYPLMIPYPSRMI